MQSGIANEWDGVLVPPRWNVATMTKSLQKDDDTGYLKALGGIATTFKGISTALSAAEDGALPALIDSVEDQLKEYGGKVVRVVFKKKDKDTVGDADKDFVTGIGKNLVMFGIAIAKGTALAASVKTLVPAVMIGLVVWFRKRAEEAQLAKNTILAGRLMENLNLCRQRAAERVLAHRAKQLAISDRVFEYGENEFVEISAVSDGVKKYSISENTLEILRLLLHEVGIEHREIRVDIVPVTPLVKALVVECWSVIQRVETSDFGEFNKLTKQEKDYWRTEINGFLHEADWSEDMDERKA
ncbi:MAG: hypothetical protein M1818_004788 [Claussenomyces sp. TS43310]|nr:MAG: hypothetical protein M1818_004788 [Claussenomyces sp. TS43310]